MKLIECTTCGSLEELQSAIDCAILYNVNKKYNALVYNLDCCVDDSTLRDVIRYKRILRNRLYDAAYPCATISVDNIVTQAALIALPDDCSRCKDCEAEILPSTTSTTTTTTTSTTTTSTTTQYPSNCSRYRVSGDPNAPFEATYNLTYFPCGDRIPLVTISIVSTDIVDLCCVPDTITVDPFFTVTLLNSICIP